MKWHIIIIVLISILGISGFWYLRHIEKNLNLQLSQLQSGVQIAKKNVGSLQGEKIDTLEFGRQTFAVYKIFVEYAPLSKFQTGIIVIKPNNVGEDGPMLASPFAALQLTDKPYAITKDNLLLIDGSASKINKYTFDDKFVLVSSTDLSNIIDQPGKIECNFQDTNCVISSSNCSVSYNSSTNIIGKSVCKE